VLQEEAFDLPNKLIHRALITFTHQKLITFTHQKLIAFTHQNNGNNGKQRVFVYNTRNTTLYFFTLMLHIFKPFNSLHGWEATAAPLEIYQTPAGDICAIIANDISVAMHATATALYGLHQIKHARELQLLSSHSICVGACLVLHAHEFTGPQIQFLLHWKSDAFMAYLRNLGFLAVQQNVALSALASATCHVSSEFAFLIGFASILMHSNSTLQEPFSLFFFYLFFILLVTGSDDDVACSSLFLASAYPPCWGQTALFALFL
jgi:hypothetical protein